MIRFGATTTPPAAAIAVLVPEYDAPFDETLVRPMPMARCR